MTAFLEPHPSPVDVDVINNMLRPVSAWSAISSTASVFMTVKRESFLERLGFRR